MNRFPLITVLCTLTLMLIATTAISIDAVETALTNRLRNSDREVAHAIAIGLSRANVSLDDTQSLVDAHFALGTYQKIKLLDAQGRVIYQRERQTSAAGSGAENTRLFWFWTLKPREQLPAAAAPVKFSQLGITNVSVQSLLTFDHHASEQWLVRLLMIFTACTAGCCALLWQRGRRIHGDLMHLQSALERLTESERAGVGAPRTPLFATIFRCVEQLGESISQRTQRALDHVDQLNRLRRTDSATGLLNREALILRLQQVGNDLPVRQTARIVLVRMLNLPELNLQSGRVQVDQQLAQIGRQIIALSPEPVEASGRISGSDIALITSASAAVVDTLVLHLRPLFDASRIAIRVDTLEFDRNERAQDVLRRCEANQTARPDTQIPEGDQREVWYQRLSWALAQHHFFLKGFRVIDRQGDVVQREFFLRLPDPKAGMTHTGGPLMAWAEHLNLAAEIDLEVVNLALSMAAEHSGRICINVSDACLLDPQRRQSLLGELRQSPRYCGRIDIDINEAFAFANPAVTAELCTQLSTLGVGVGLDQLDARAGSLMLLQGFGVRYIKVAAAVTADLLDAQQGRDRSRLLSELVHSAHALSMQVYAAGVASEALARGLLDLGFDAVTGPGIGE